MELLLVVVGGHMLTSGEQNTPLAVVSNVTCSKNDEAEASVLLVCFSLRTSDQCPAAEPN